MSSRNYRLTKSEKILITLVGHGLSNDQIAKKMYVSVHTVKAQLSAAFRKINAVNRANAVYIAMQDKRVK